MTRPVVKNWLKPRATCCWALAGFALLQLGLGLAVDQLWLDMRDPEFAQRLRLLDARIAENPGKPLVLLVGSSRTMMAVRAEKLSASANGPLVFNLTIPGSGVLMQHVAVRRVLDHGVRPDLVFLEAIPMFLNSRNRNPLEERMLESSRLNAQELLGLLPHCSNPCRVARRWLLARALPTNRYGNALRGRLAADGSYSPWEQPGMNGHGWMRPQMEITPENVARTKLARGIADMAYRDFSLGAGHARVFLTTLELCRRAKVPAAVLIPAEDSYFRGLYGPATKPVEDFVFAAARAYLLNLYDTRTWVADDGFWDGHHMWAKGADQYTERFAREALGPEMRRLHDGALARSP